MCSNELLQHANHLKTSSVHQNCWKIITLFLHRRKMLSISTLTPLKNVNLSSHHSSVVRADTTEASAPNCIATLLFAPIAATALTAGPAMSPMPSSALQMDESSS
mmetsp:Transcript_28027/g.56302  ORF Transcript_28027/g.56302 Transcript_28027/m.56302 type:complete len:105 (+) Transcript_28027:653-967(+)